MSAQSPTLARVLGGWTPEPAVIAVLCLAAVAYGWGMVRSRGRVSWWRAASFAAGLFVVALALLSGIDRYADELLSVHVLEHLLLLLIAPLLVLWGAPVRLALAASPPGARRALALTLGSPVVRLLTRPALGFALFTVVVLGTHLSGVYEAALRNATVHAVEHGAYFWSGVVFLTPLLAVDPVPHPPGAIARFSWLMAAMVVMALPAGAFLFAAHVRYPFYLAPARALHTSALADQRSAGVLMLVAGGMAMGVLAIVIAMGAMLAEERRQQRRELYSERHADGGPPAGQPAARRRGLAGL
jgi:putative membrane protein